MTAATITIEHVDGTTEVWNTSQSQADSIRHQLLGEVGAADLEAAGARAPAAERRP